MQRASIGWFILTSLLLSIGAANAHAHAPLDAAARRSAESVPDEGTPDPGEHYPVSNEWRHDLWFPHLQGLGGAFVGVGSDQCYTLMAVQDAEVAFLVDFDPLVPLVHAAYGVLVRASPTPAELLARFDEGNADATRALLHESLAQDPRRDAIVRLFDRDRPRLARYLSRVVRGQRGPTWLSDATLYARVRSLFEAGRVISRNGDLTGDRTVLAIGEAARALGVTVRALYVSNADQFFSYAGGFERNVRALPTDERTLLLHTFRDRRAVYPTGDRWHYVVHRWPDFLARLEAGYRRSQQLVADLVGSRGAQGADGSSVMDERVPRRAFGSDAAR